MRFNAEIYEKVYPRKVEIPEIESSVDTFKHELNEFTSQQSGGVCFRCIVNGKMGYASTENLSAQQAVSVVLPLWYLLRAIAPTISPLTTAVY